MIKNWRLFTESLDDDTSKLDYKYSDVKKHVLELIYKSVNSESSDVVREFIESYIESKESNVIEGLVNDSDYFDMYVKFSSDIDELLESVNYYDKSPSEKGIYSVYDYVVESTKESISEVFLLLREELFGISKESSDDSVSKDDELN
jgi:hypothetical protein